VPPRTPLGGSVFATSASATATPGLATATRKVVDGSGSRTCGIAAA
jgi:hypothetical protein